MRMQPQSFIFSIRKKIMQLKVFYAIHDIAYNDVFNLMATPNQIFLLIILSIF